MTKNSEIKLIIACARTEQTPRVMGIIKEQVGKISDWQKVICLSSFHRVGALLYNSLKKTCPDSVPPEILSRLKKKYADNAARNLSLSIKLLKIINLFKKNNVRAIPFKGPVIAEKAYEDLNLRSFSDLDILIKKKDVPTAKNLLVQYGFKAEFKLSPELEQKYLKYENSISFYNKNNLSIDLHWEITGRYLLNHLYFESFADRLQITSFLGQKITCLPDDVMLVYLSVHGTSHCWNKFEWLCCFVELIKRQNEKTIINAFNLAETLGAKRIFLLGLYLGQNLLDAQYPKKIEIAITSDQGIISCANKIKKQMFEQKIYLNDDAAWRFSPTHILIRDSYFDRFRYLVCLLFMPTIKELTKYQLPSRLTLLYYLIRPLRLATAYFFANKIGGNETNEVINHHEKAEK